MSRIRKLALVTDAWAPQINGVVFTLQRLVEYTSSQGIEVWVISPDGHRRIPLPSYPEIEVAIDPWKAVSKVTEFAPDAVHIATEGPLGLWVSRWLARRSIEFTTSFHTRFPEYSSARYPVPLALGYAIERWFHGRAKRTLVGTRSLIGELRGNRVGRQLVHWPRGVDTQRFHPRLRSPDTFAGLPGPIWLYVGRVAAEKSLEDFLKLSLPGSKVVVGDGPARRGLAARFGDVIWRGYLHGRELGAHFAGADCFVFPSRTETFGNVILEAFASGLPVASVPAPGPIDLIEEGSTGSVSDDLRAACMAAVGCSRARARARASALEYTYEASHTRFLQSLVPARPASIPLALESPQKPSAMAFGR